MAQMKENHKYYFTVEGETERWYLQWLQYKINTELIFVINSYSSKTDPTKPRSVLL